MAWSPGPFGQVVDYGRIEVATDDLGVEQATMVALRQFRSMVTAGWPVGVAGGEPMKVSLTLVDAGYMTDVVYAFCRETGNRFLPSVGRGASQQHQQHYNRQTQTGSIVKHLGEGFHINWLPTAQSHLVTRHRIRPRRIGWGIRWRRSIGLRVKVDADAECDKKCDRQEPQLLHDIGRFGFR